jgi:bifunctional ADP-heptose synthase (sugar kinase/adenylyltransferase)
MALALAAGTSFATAAEIANHAAGIVIEKEGTAVLSFMELAQRISQEFL